MISRRWISRDNCLNHSFVKPVAIGAVGIHVKLRYPYQIGFKIDLQVEFFSKRTY